MTTADPCTRSRGSETSQAAYDASVNHHEADRARILDLIRFHGTLTLDEACVLMGRDANQLSGRMTELHRKGAIVRTGEKRPTRTGCKAAVYRIAPPPGQLF